MSDSIDKLPINDEAQPTKKELNFIKELFNNPENQKTAKTVISELKDYLLAGALFIIFSLEILNKGLKYIIPVVSGSSIILTIIKALLFTITFYVIRNFVLAFK
tara:strand:+ start:1497 stop:1808 length:312 start_codon:yes stop_codon:yes gene_type:complete